MPITSDTAISPNSPTDLLALALADFDERSVSLLIASIALVAVKAGLDLSVIMTDAEEAVQTYLTEEAIAAARPRSILDVTART